MVLYYTGSAGQTHITSAANEHREKEKEMKRLLILVGILLVAGVAFAADVTPLPYGFPVMGTPVDNTFKATLIDTAQSIQTLAETAGITWTQSGRDPNGVLITVETNAARTGTANVAASGTVGHLIAVGGAWRIPGTGYINASYLCSATAGDNAVVQITLER